MSVLLFTGSIFFLYFFSRKTLNELYYFLKKLLKKNSLVYLVISVIFFPGTFLHEISHAIMARMLFLKVLEIKLTPEWKGNSIRLGRVTYIKGDFIRSILIGVAPVFAGIALFLWMAMMKIFPNPNMGINILLIYIIFVISTTMFSSKQDLVDVGFLIPVIAITGAILYFFNINIFYYVTTLAGTNTWNFISVQVTSMNYMIVIALTIHIIMILTLKLLRRIIF